MNIWIYKSWYNYINIMNNNYDLRINNIVNEINKFNQRIINKEEKQVKEYCIINKVNNKSTDKC